MKIVGHRGAKGLAAENSLSAIQAALNAHADEVEFDVRVTRDKVPVLCHNQYIVDESNQPHRIAESDYTQLQSIDSQLTTLTQALDLIDTKLLPMIEVKAGEDTAPIVQVLKAYITSGMYGPRDLCLGSKSQKTLRQLHESLPDIPVVVIEPWSSLRATWRARRLHTRLISMNQLFLWRFFIRSVSKRGWQLYAYTLNDPVKAERWKLAGLFGVITDFPDRFKP